MDIYKVNEAHTSKMFNDFDNGGRRTPMIIDDQIFIKTEFSGKVFSDNMRRTTLNITNPPPNFDFTKVKNVHFLKGAYFDRDYFRRLYPDVSIRNKPESADIIIYDDKSLFANDNKPMNCINIDDGKYRVNTIPHVLNQWYRTTVPNSYEQRYYPNWYKLGKPEDCVLVNACINTIKNRSGKHEYLIETNDYFESINKSGKPLIKTDDVFRLMPSDNVESNISFDTVLALFKQLSSKNIESKKAALETLIQYSYAKYLPIQALGILLCDYKAGPTSHKLNLFISTHIQNCYSNTRHFFNSYNAYARYSAAGTNQTEEYPYTLEGFFAIIDKWVEMLKQTKARGGDKGFDWELTKKVVYSYDFSEIFISKIKLGGENIKVTGLNWSLDMPELIDSILVPTTGQAKTDINEFLL